MVFIDEAGLPKTLASHAAAQPTSAAAMTARKTMSKVAALIVKEWSRAFDSKITQRTEASARGDLGGMIGSGSRIGRGCGYLVRTRTTASCLLVSYRTLARFCGPLFCCDRACYRS